MNYAASIIVCLLPIVISKSNSIKTLHTLWNERPTCHQDNVIIWRLFERCKNEKTRDSKKKKSNRLWKIEWRSN